MPDGPSSLFTVPGWRTSSPDPVGLVAASRSVPDPRQRRGVRDSSTLLLAVAGALAGSKSLRAIAEWVVHAPSSMLESFGLLCRPSEKTIRLLLEYVDVVLLTRVLAGWLGNRAGRRARRPGGRRLIAVDGKTTRGARDGDARARHLVAALEHTTGVVLGQVQVDGKTNEISAFSVLLDVLLDGIDIAGAVVTADALHTQRGHAEYCPASVKTPAPTSANTKKLLPAPTSSQSNSRAQAVCGVSHSIAVSTLASRWNGTRSSTATVTVVTAATMTRIARR